MPITKGVNITSFVKSSLLSFFFSLDPGGTVVGVVFLLVVVVVGLVDITLLVVVVVGLVVVAVVVGVVVMIIVGLVVDGLVFVVVLSPLGITLVDVTFDKPEKT